MTTPKKLRCPVHDRHLVARDSLAYQYYFFDQHGRWPTWADAMAHCGENMKTAWTKALTERGVDINGPSNKRKDTNEIHTDPGR